MPRSAFAESSADDVRLGDLCACGQITHVAFDHGETAIDSDAVPVSRA